MPGLVKWCSMMADITYTINIKNGTPEHAANILY